MRSLLRLAVGLLVVASCLWLPSTTLAADAQVRGVVQDQSGAVITGAVVTLVDTASGRVVTALTGTDGRFHADAVPTGQYDIAAAAAGFDVVGQRIDVGEGAQEPLTFVLAVARQTVRVEVAGQLASNPVRLPDERPRTDDAARLLDGLPGVSVAGSGGVSGIPAIHGLADDRVKLTVNGMTIAAACSGHMNPPLSYIDPGSLASITVMAGITPVSAGGDSIGGSVAVESARPAFAGEGVEVHASATAFTRSNSGATGGNASFSAATSHLRIGYVGSYAAADNYVAGGGQTVKSTFYTTATHGLQMAVTGANQTFTGDVSMQRVPEQGYANARMDMTRNNSTSGSLRYETSRAWGHVDARGYLERTDHQMNILRDKVPGMNMPMNTRGQNVGYTVTLDRMLGRASRLRAGSELHRFTLDDWWPGVMMMVSSMGPDTLQNINNGRRTRIGTFGEWEVQRGAWTVLAGLRNDIVSMNTGAVTGYNMSPTATGSAAYYADAVEFNARDRARRDVNVDATLLARTAPTPTTSFEFGYARKTRSPSLYERYLWVKRSNMAVQMNGWFGDGNGYTGNVDLKPEVAHTFSGTAGWHSASHDRELSITPYVTRVPAYIDVDRCAAIAGSNGCTAAKLTATTGFVNLQFANHDARLYGFDLSGESVLAESDTLGRFSASGVVNYVRGRLLDTGDNVYRLMPLDARVSLDHARGPWTSAFTVQGVGAKNRVQATRVELATKGYVLLNVRSGYQFRAFRVDAGIDNIADRKYTMPLGGRYWIGDATGATGVPGMGRTLYVSVGAKL